MAGIGPARVPYADARESARLVPHLLFVGARNASGRGRGAQFVPRNGVSGVVLGWDEDATEGRSTMPPAPFLEIQVLASSVARNDASFESRFFTMT